MKKILLLLLVCMLGACTQIELAKLYFANNGTEVQFSQPLPVTLPYRDVDGWVIVQASVNGSPPVDFVLDTGASLIALLIDEKSAALGIDVSDAKRLGAEDDLAAPVGKPVSGLDIDLGPLRFLDQSALAIPMESVMCFESGARRDPPFRGVLGHELFHRYVVEINRDRAVVILHDPESWEYRGAGQIVEANIESRQPYLTVQVQPPQGDAYNARLHVDTGANIFLTLFPVTSDRIVVPEGGVESEACFVGGRATYHSGTNVDLTFGAGTVETAPVEYATGGEVIDSGQNGRLGAKFLERFNVVFDYSREQMILEPRVTAPND